MCPTCYADVFLADVPDELSELDVPELSDAETLAALDRELRRD